jgi:hypothetical protein
VVLLALAACGPVPRPFQPVDKAAPDPVTPSLGARAGILVRPVDGMAPGLAATLSRHLVAALWARDIPASARYGNRASLVLTARAAEPDAPSPVLQWTLRGADGFELAAFDDPAADDGRDRTLMDENAVEALAGRVAARIVAIVEPSTTPDSPAGTAKWPPVVLWSVDGAPGDAGRSLSIAMRRALERSGVKLASEISDGAYVLVGSVHIEPAGQNGALVEIAWTLLRPDGERVGTVSQSNKVPADVVKGPWGPLATVVAQNGVEGVIALLTGADQFP